MPYTSALDIFGRAKWQCRKRGKSFIKRPPFKNWRLKRKNSRISCYAVRKAGVKLMCGKGDGYILLCLITC